MGGEEAQREARADAFRLLADRHLDASYRLAYVILGQRAEAEDATHDAFVAAWRNWSSLRDQSLFERWFDRILVNTCRNRLRYAARRPSHDLTDELPGLTPLADDDFAPLHDRGELWPALSRLGADQRVVVALRFYRELTIDEIAARMETRPGTVKSRLHRALRELRTLLDDDSARTRR
jgi:RNA polymerase sigma-70 factor (ECF subfamily)